MSPVKNRTTGRAIIVESARAPVAGASMSTLPSGYVGVSSLLC